jgi:hypothetical protein
MMDFFGNFGKYLEIIILAIPFIVAIILIIKYVLPKRPALGIGLAGGVGLVGYFLVRNKLKRAFQVEDQIADHIKDMAEFKNVQKNRYKAVLANKEIIDELEKQRTKLAKNSDKYETEIKLLDAELADRRAMNEKLLDNSKELLKTTEERTSERDDLLQRFMKESGVSGIVSTPATTPTAGEQIEINGYRLKEIS